MTRSRFVLVLRSALCALLLAVAGLPALAAGVLVPSDGSPPIRLRSHRVTAVVEDGLARTTVRQTFVNPHGRTLEAVYLFPVPEDAALVGLAMEVGGQRLEGLLAERRTARRAYDRLVRRQIDPALVEQVGRGKFRLSVYPVLPDQETVVEITWIQQIPLVQGEFRYVYPLALVEDATGTDRDLTISVTLRSSAPMTSVAAGAGLDARLVTPYEVRASVERVGVRLDRDVVVAAKVVAREPSLAVRTFRGATGDPFFSAVVTPPDVAEDQVLARDVTLVLDTSGSMHGIKIEQAKASALWLLDHLRAKDAVNVLLFSSDVRRFAQSPVPATPENLQALRAFVAEVRAGGGTALGDAIQAAAAAPTTPGRVAMTVLLTDGEPTMGECTPSKIVEFAKAGAERGLRTFAFGVGADVNAALLEGVAHAGRGESQTFRPQGEIESRLAAFMTRTSSPVLADLRIEIDGAPVDDLLPRPLRDLYLGEQAVLTGRTRLSGVHEVVVRGAVAGKEIVLRRSVDFPAAPGGSPVVRDLYAHAKLAFLERAVRLRAGLNDEAYFAALDHGAYSTQDELVGAIVALSLETGVQCPYTSFFAMLPEDRARLDPRDAAAIDEGVRRAAEKRREIAAAAGAAPATADASPPPQRTPVGPPDRIRDLPPASGPRLELTEEEPPPTPEETRSLEESERVVEDPVLEDAKISDYYETDSDMETEESLGDPRFNSDSPFEGPGANRTIGIGGGAGGAFGGRRGGHRNLRAGGGGKKTQTAVDLALDWLARHQAPDGHWDADGAAGGADDADVGVTGLSLLAFLGAGETHQSGPYKDAVRRGLRYLRDVQDSEGCFGDRSKPRWMFNHLAACLAMTEAYGMTQSVLFRESAQRGVNFVHQCRHPQGGWGNGVRSGLTDRVITTWAVMCLKSAALAELEIDRTAFGGALAAIEAGTDPLTGLVRQNAAGLPQDADAFPTPTESALVAGGVLTRIFAHAALGSNEARTDAMLGKGAERLAERLPSWGPNGEGVDLHAWYLGSLAMYQVGGDPWKRWNETMSSALLGNQHAEEGSDARGSWDPMGPWNHVGGRVYATALNCLCLEVYYRYGRVFGTSVR